jgi:hypothetical protein
MKQIEYSKLRLDVLSKLITHREIECRETRNEMIKYLQLDDEGKYIRETTIEKYEKDKFLIGIDLGNQKQLIEMGKLIQEDQAKDTNMYYNCRKYFISNVKLSE